MKSTMLVCALTFLTGAVIAAESEDVKSAAKKLAAQSGYSWRTTVEVPANSRFRPGPTEGKTERDGYTRLSMSFGENSVEAVLKGDKGAAKMEGEWRALDDLEGPGAFLGRYLRNFKTPAASVEETAGKTKDLKKDGDAYAGDLTDDGAKSLVSFGGASVSKASGSVRFWLKDGQLAKYQYKVQGTINVNGEDREVERTTTVEIKDVGTTKVEIPEEAKKKIS
jgi:hypothetical protein